MNWVLQQDRINWLPKWRCVTIIVHDAAVRVIAFRHTSAWNCIYWIAQKFLNHFTSLAFSPQHSSSFHLFGKSISALLNYSRFGKIIFRCSLRVGNWDAQSDLNPIAKLKTRISLSTAFSKNILFIAISRGVLKEGRCLYSHGTNLELGPSNRGKKENERINTKKQDKKRGGGKIVTATDFYV